MIKTANKPKRRVSFAQNSLISWLIKKRTQQILKTNQYGKIQRSHRR